MKGYEAVLLVLLSYFFLTVFIPHSQVSLGFAKTPEGVYYEN